MNPMLLTAASLVASLVVLSTNRYSTELVLLGVLLFLSLLGVVTPEQAFSGFAHPGTLSVGALFVVAAALQNTGLVASLARKGLKQHRDEHSAVLSFSTITALLSSCINNTPVVAILLPVVRQYTRRFSLNERLFFLPLSFASMLGGLWTSIGTSTNVVLVTLAASQNAADSIGLFFFAPVGLPTLVAGLLYLGLAAPALLGGNRHQTSGFEDPRHYTTAFCIRADSKLAGQSIASAGLRHLGQVYLSHVQRDENLMSAPSPDFFLQTNDVLMFVGDRDGVSELTSFDGLVPYTSNEEDLRLRTRRKLTEAVISPASPLVGLSIKDAAIRSRYGAVVLAVHRSGEKIDGKIGDIRLRPGDALLLEAPQFFIRSFFDSKEFYLISASEDPASPKHDKKYLAALILALFIVTVLLQLIPLVQACLVAGFLMIATGCLSGPQARRSIDWSIILSLGAAVGLGQAVQNSGLSAWLGEHFLTQSSTALSLISVFAVTQLLTAFMNNSAAVLVLYPVVTSAFGGLQTSAGKAAFCVLAVSASCAFVTPIGYQTNLMVMGPGGYRWGDYVRLGLPLSLICCGVATGAALLWF